MGDFRCQGKTAYVSKTEAYNNVVTRKKRRRLQVYRCPICKKYHVGNGSFDEWER